MMALPRRMRSLLRRSLGLAVLLGGLLLAGVLAAGRPTAEGSVPPERARIQGPRTLPDESRRDFSESCFDNGCHARLRERRWLHTPFAGRKCSACHEPLGPPEKHQYRLAGEKERLCASCHKAPPGKPVRHEPFAKSQCVVCHDPHGGENRVFLPAPVSGALCIRCHDGKEHDGKRIAAAPGKAGFPHQPVERGECNSCHLSHQSAFPHLLTRDPKLDLCLGCHRSLLPPSRAVDGRRSAYALPDPLPAGVPIPERKPPGALPDLLVPGSIPPPPPPDSVFYFVIGPLHGDPFREAAPADTVANTTVQLVLVHEPLTRDCSSCHRPHGSEVAKILRAPVPALCNGCHGDTLTARIIRARSSHGRALDKEACTTCHAGHTARHAHLLRTSSRPACMKCHDKPVPASDPRVIRGIQAEVTEAVSVHAPVATGCAACHRSHAASERSLLRGRYPEANYAPYARETYGLCFDCHDPRRIQEPATERTGFRNGERNLHQLHVLGERSGRTCGTCHESHASTRPDLIRRQAPFGPARWPLPIAYQKTATGGSCSAGCHRRLFYDRVAPVRRQSGEAAKASGE